MEGLQFYLHLSYTSFVSLTYRTGVFKSLFARLRKPASGHVEFWQPLKETFK